MDDIIKEIYLNCTLYDICNLYIINKQWYNVSKIYRQSISKSILNKNGYFNFDFDKKNNELNYFYDYYHILKTFINYDSKLQKNIIKTYLDGKYNLCYFIIINDNFNNLSEKVVKDHFKEYDIDFLVESILDYFFLVKQRSTLNNKSLLIYLIKWKINQLNNIYNKNYNTDNYNMYNKNYNTDNYLSNFYLLELHGFLNKKFQHYNNQINYWKENNNINNGSIGKYRYKYTPLNFLHKYNIKQNLIMYLEDNI